MDDPAGAFFPRAAALSTPSSCACVSADTMNLGFYLEKAEARNFSIKGVPYTLSGCPPNHFSGHGTKPGFELTVILLFLALWEFGGIL